MQDLRVLYYNIVLYFILEYHAMSNTIMYSLMYSNNITRFLLLTHKYP